MDKTISMKLVEQASRATPSQFIVNFEKLYGLINEHEKARKGKEFVDSGGKITDEGWKVLEEREREQARGGSMTQIGNPNI